MTASKSHRWFFYGTLLLTSTLLGMLPTPVQCHSGEEEEGEGEKDLSANAAGTHTDCTVEFCEVVLSENLVKRYKIHVPQGWEYTALTDVNEYNACKDCQITVELAYEGLAWIGFGVSRQGNMIGSHVVIGQPQVSEPKLYRIFGKDINLIEPSDHAQDLIDATIDFIDGKTFMEFTIKFEHFGVESPLDTEPMGISLSGESTFIWAHGNDGENTLGYHGPNKRAYTKVDLASHPVVMADTGSPMKMEGEGYHHHDHSSKHKAAWASHGVFAFLAWGICAPIAIAAAILRDIDGPTVWRVIEMVIEKGLKLLGRDSSTDAATSSSTTDPNPAREWVEKSVGVFSYWWFYIHMGCNTINYLFTFILFCIAVPTSHKEGDGNIMSHFEHAHSKMGMAMFTLATFQITSGYFRPAKVHKDDVTSEDETNQDENAGSTNGRKSIFSKMKMDKVELRRAWEIFHNVLGITLFICGVWQIWEGMHLYRQRYSHSQTTVWSVIVYSLYIAWMFAWSLIIVGGSAFKWVHRGVFGKGKDVSQFDGNVNEQGIEAIGKFEIGDAEDDVDDEAEKKLQEEVREVI